MVEAGVETKNNQERKHKMTNEQINAAIADACGWRKEDGVWMWTRDDIDWTSPDPFDWCDDLNEMHEVEKMLTPLHQDEYWDHIKDIAGEGFDQLHATARQRAEAFLKTIGKWEEL